MKQRSHGIAFPATVASLFIGALAAAVPAQAQTWNGAGANDNWSTGANWSGGVAPASSAATHLTFGASPRPTPVVDAPWTVNRMDFASELNSLSGQAITFDGAGALISVGIPGVVFSNPIVLAAPVTASDFASSITLLGPLSGPGSFTVSTISGGIVFLTAVNTYTGGTTVALGTLDLQGSILGPVSVADRLTGSGTVSGPVTLTGPTASLVPAVVLRTGNLALGGGKLSISIAGPAQGIQYGTADVTGTVDVSGASLVISGSYTPVPGDVFTIVANDATDAVTGTFAGLPEGATVTFNGVPLRISYVGGTGNDVTLTALAAATPAATAQIPTLSEWGLILLTLLLIVTGSMRLRRAR